MWRFSLFLLPIFITGLTERTNLASQLYLKADELAADSLVQVQQKYLEKLPDEVIRIYDDYNLSAFNMKNNIYWTKEIINRYAKMVIWSTKKATVR
jgi:hypothetical protein